MTNLMTSDERPNGPVPAGPFSVPAVGPLPMTHRMATRGKLGVTSRTEAAAVAVRLGLAD